MSTALASPGEHRHCRVCGAVVKPGSETCSDACARERQRRLSSARTYRYVLYAMIAFLLVVLLATYR